MNKSMLEKFGVVIDLLGKKETAQAHKYFNSEIYNIVSKTINSNKTLIDYRILFYELDELFNNSQRQALYPSDIDLIISEYRDLVKKSNQF
jgi:hypothetical protein